jgi:hypothetical protein
MFSVSKLRVREPLFIFSEEVEAFVEKAFDYSRKSVDEANRAVGIR